jgi:ABC-type multidrug transport system fused ATPase/permease subunit
MSRNIDEDKHIRKKLTTQRTLGSMVEEILTFILKVYIIVIAIYQKLTIGTITMYISSLDNVKEICKEILSSITSTYEDCLYIKNYFEIMQEDTVDEKDKICIDGKIDLIEFRNVSFRYPGELHNTLNNINVKIKKNTTYALIGLNGSGKTTFLKLLLKLYKPTAGEIYLNGVNLDDYNQADLFSNIGVVFQDFIRYPFDVKTNIAVGNGGNEIDINYIKKISNMLGLEKDIKELKNEYDTQLKKEWTEGTELSGGQWQKIAIARGLIKKNYSMLILDEPTAALDSLSEYNIFQKFKSIKRGKIAIFVTHRMCNVPLADEIIVLKNGSILEQGTHSDLMDIKGEYYALYNNQLNMYRRERE